MLIGCKSGAEVGEALRYLELNDEERDYAPVLGTLRNDFKGNCVYCSHCEPCPVQIDIASVNKFLDIARLDLAHIPPSVRSHYRALGHGGDSCIGCGSCEKRCPFGVPIVENMAEAAALFRDNEN